MRANSAVVRRGIRVVSMVHELHKRGFQQLRALPALSPSGMHWRCLITDASNTDRDGVPVSWSERPDAVVAYSTGQGARYFGWEGFENASARAMAENFVTAFPSLADRARGRDWEYAGWLVELLGRMEQLGDEGLIYFIADFPVDLESMGMCLPPPWKASETQIHGKRNGTPVSCFSHPTDITP